MTVDLRAFDYGLEPLRRQRQWQLDAARARLARAQHAIREAETALAAQQDHHRAQCDSLARASSRTLDLATRRPMLEWLAQSHAALAQAEADLTTLRDDARRIALDCTVAEQRLELIERHRSECLAQFAQEEQARQAAEADRDWLSRETQRHAFAPSPSLPDKREAA